MKKIVFKNGIYKLIRIVGATAVIENEEGRVMVPAANIKEIKEEPKEDKKEDKKEEPKPKKRTRKTSKKKGAAK